MAWCWPLKGCTPLFPDEPGKFGTARTHDIHTGVDLYCALGTEVVAVEDGEVISIEGFTGPNADDPSPWWNDTDAILIRGKSGVVVYGEVSACVKEGDTVKAGQPVAVIANSVLKKFKERPMVMLHIELMVADAEETVWWKLDEDRPKTLLDPSGQLMGAARTVVGWEWDVFSLHRYEGTEFRPPA